MNITGENIIGAESLRGNQETVTVMDPKSQQQLPGEFHVASSDEIELAMQKAQRAFAEFSRLSGARRAEFLRAIAEEILRLDVALIERAMKESGLPEARFKGERGRTVGQLRMFADLLDEGSWVEATIDAAQPDRTPMPRADIRRMLVSTGPVVVFTASNFPLAFSTAGGDTASALASGCPVIVKAHESHLGTNELVSKAIQIAAEKTRMPDGVFSSLTGNGYELGTKLVQHPLVKSVAFTGSHRGGLALHKLAQERAEPIPVFAEMGSINPMLLLPSAVETNHKLPQIILTSVTMGVGQFCTNPGLLLAIKSSGLEHLKDALQEEFAKAGSFTMLNEGIHRNYESLKKETLAQSSVRPEAVVEHDDSEWSGKPAVVSVDAGDFIGNPNLHREVFGPFTMIVECVDGQELTNVLRSLEGQLTGTVYGEENDFDEFSSAISELEQKVGRIIFNQVPTGVEVCAAMQHGGPYPATTDSRFTSVGTGAIRRFVRPQTFQNWPQSRLPKALQDGNPLQIWRWVESNWTK